MSSPVELTVQWKKDVFEVSLIPSDGVTAWKEALQTKTGVPVARQKLMSKVKGKALWKGVLKDDADLTAVDWGPVVKGKVAVMLMGTAEALKAPTTKTVFVEDLPPEMVAKVQEPSGLVNLGNTCYMNSVVQCLRKVDPLRDLLQQYNPHSSTSTTTNPQSTVAANPAARGLVSALADTMTTLDRQATAVQPTRLVSALWNAVPQFATRTTGPSGMSAPQQQDAEECYSSLLQLLSTQLTQPTASFAATATASSSVKPPPISNAIDAIFSLQMTETMTCTETTAETPTERVDTARKLTCNIQGGSDRASDQNVSHISQGILLSLEGTAEKESAVLGRNAIWKRTQRVSRLPPILTVQFGRFYWKATPDSQDHTGVKCKVMKPVAFNAMLDVYEFCTAEVQKTLKMARDKALAEEEDRITKKLKGEEAGATANKAEAGTSMEIDTEESVAAAGDGEDEAALQAALAMSMQTDEESTKKDGSDEKTFIGYNLPDDFQGHYELFAVVTHKGRDADGGHYMSWVKAGEGTTKIADTDEMNDDWFVFDDDEVSACKTEDVLRLKGGGDWHMSYLNFYRAKK